VLCCRVEILIIPKASVDLFAELGAVEVVRDAVTPPMLRKIKR
jgi:hypothetical protein